MHEYMTDDDTRSRLDTIMKCNTCRMNKWHTYVKTEELEHESSKNGHHILS